MLYRNFVKCGLLTLIIHCSLIGFSQQNRIYVKFTSNNTKTPRGVNIYVNTTYASSYYVMVPSDKYYSFKCDSTRAVSLIPDPLKYPNISNLSFNKTMGSFSCGDSVIINVDTEQAKVINIPSQR